MKLGRAYYLLLQVWSLAEKDEGPSMPLSKVKLPASDMAGTGKVT
jgi:hypothetical protein